MRDIRQRRHSLIRMLIVVAAMGAAVLAVPATASAVGLTTGTGTTVGPLEINLLGHADLCWEASGNGAPITLEACSARLQNEQWSLTPDGVLMNGIGYCMESLPGQPDGTAMYIDFAGQCGGQSSGQVWRYDGADGQLESAGACAGLGGPAVPGASIVRARCPQANARIRWSLGDSAITLTGRPGGGPANGTFTARVTVADGASAQAAYGVSVKLTLPRPLTASGPRGPSGLRAPSGPRGPSGLHGPSGWHCRPKSLTCTGSLAAGTSGHITVTGRWPSSARTGTSFTLTAIATVTGTTSRSGKTNSVRIPLTVTAETASARSVDRPASVPSGLIVAAILAALLLFGGGTLIWITRRQSRQEPAKPE